MMQQPKISRYVFRVSHKEKLTPHYIRIKFRADEDIDFNQCTLGANNKIFIPPKGVSEVHFPEFDETKGEWVHPSEELKPIVRTYTHRAIDPVTKEITIDFVNHGDNGPASAWAAKSKGRTEVGGSHENPTDDTLSTFRLVFSDWRCNRNSRDMLHPGESASYSKRLLPD
ncbi:MAG: siderophore-interacting protein [Sphingobacterium hotanense]